MNHRVSQQSVHGLGREPACLSFRNPGKFKVIHSRGGDLRNGGDPQKIERFLDTFGLSVLNSGLQLDANFHPHRTSYWLGQSFPALQQGTGLITLSARISLEPSRAIGQ